MGSRRRRRPARSRPARPNRRVKPPRRPYSRTPRLCAPVPGCGPRDHARPFAEDLLNLAYATRALDIPAAWATLADLANLPRPHDPPGPTAHDDERWDPADVVVRREADPHDRTGA